VLPKGGDEMKRPSNLCTCCGTPLEYHHYTGELVKRLFGFKPGDTISDLCPGCYCMLFREYLIERGDRGNENRGMVNACEGCELHKNRVISKVYYIPKCRRGRKGPQLKGRVANER
jgi:hypothetical protein